MPTDESGSTIAGVAFKNGACTSCPLLIVFHGMGGSGEALADSSQPARTFSTMHTLFQGITVYPTIGHFALPGLDGWGDNIRVVETIMAMPEVDPTRVYLQGFSAGGFLMYSMACFMGNRLAAVVPLAALKEAPTTNAAYDPASCQRTNTLHIHNLNDNYNMVASEPRENADGTTADMIGIPADLVNDWVAGGTGPAGSTSSTAGTVNGLFTHYSATADGLAYNYYGCVSQ